MPPPPPPHPIPHTNTHTQALVYDILPSTTAVFSYAIGAIGARKLSDNELFFVGAQTVVNLLQTTQIISDVCFVTMLLTQIFLAQIKPKSFESILLFFLFFFLSLDLGSIPLRLSFLFKSCGLWTLSCDFVPHN